MNRIDAHGLKFQEEALGRFCFAVSNSWREQNERPPLRNMMSSQHFSVSSFGELRSDQRRFRAIQTAPSAFTEPQRSGCGAEDAGIRHDGSGGPEHGNSQCAAEDRGSHIFWM